MQARSRYKVFWRSGIIPGIVILLTAPAQCRGADCLGASKSIPVQDLNCEQMRESGCNSYNDLILRAEPKAKTVTSPLIIPAVLCLGVYLGFESGTKGFNLGIHR